MLFVIFLITTILFSGAFLYFVEYCYLGSIAWWSVVPVIIGAYGLSILLFFIFLYFFTLTVSRPAKDLKKPRLVQRRITQEGCEYVMKMCRVVPVVKHKERLPEGNFLLVQNHQSIFDPLATIWAFRDRTLTFVMKKETLNVPIIGRYLKAAGFLPLDRSNNREAIRTIKAAANRITDGYNSVGIFPEGTRSHGPEVHEFRNGAFKIAEWSKCPIVVCSIDNAYKIKYHSFFKKTKILIEVVKVLTYDDYKDMNTTELGDYCHKLITDSQIARRKQYDWLKEQTEKELESETIIGMFTNKRSKKKNHIQ